MFGKSLFSFFADYLLWPWAKPPYRFQCRELKTAQAVSDRQSRIPGWKQRFLSNAIVWLIGAGGLGGQVAMGLTRQGTYLVALMDGDTVTPTNLNRQHFKPGDLYVSKPLALARNLSREGALGTKFLAYPCTFQDRPDNVPKPRLIIAGVDNQFPNTRLEVAQYAFTQRIPAIIMGVTPEADGGYVFVQRPGKACWACALRPEEQRGADKERCPSTPAAMPILQTLGGLAVYAANSILMGLPMDWDYWYVDLARCEFGGPLPVKRRSGCPICDESFNFETLAI